MIIRSESSHFKAGRLIRLAGRFYGGVERPTTAIMQGAEPVAAGVAWCLR